MKETDRILCDPNCRFFIFSRQTEEGKHAHCHAPAAGDSPDPITIVPFDIKHYQTEFDLDYSIFQFILCLHPKEKELRE